MDWLERRIPPPIVFAVLVLAMGLLPAGWPLGLQGVLRIGLAVVVAALAAICVGPALKAFRDAKTTVNPVRVDEASQLVTGGVFALTRNPMYLGLTLLLVAWALWLNRIAAFAGPVLLVAYLTRFQIMPEERALSAKFGREYEAYRARVRRWI
jgi:protein-S-isoprenylcysteine O-methyltransferase Ste14